VEGKLFGEGNNFGGQVLVSACIVIVVGGAKLAAAILVPFLLSMFIAMTLLAPVKALTRRGVSHWLSVLIVLAVTLFFFAVIFIIVGSTAAEFSIDMPSYQAQLHALIANAAAWFDARGIDLSESGLKGALNPGRVVTFFQKFVGDIGNMLSNVLLILFTVVFMLSDSALYSQKLALQRDKQSETDQKLGKISDLFDSLGAYMKIMAAVSLLTGVLIWLGLLLMGVKYPVLWGLLAFLLNFIPTIGSFIAAVPVLLLALISQEPALLLMIIGLYLVVNVVVGNFIQPIWMGGEVGLSTLAVFGSMVFWGWLFGPTGMLLSVPLTIAVKFAALQNPRTLWLAILLSNEAQHTAASAVPNAEN
jgi:predicted PurR-regulated permease PerM